MKRGCVSLFGIYTEIYFLSRLRKLLDKVINHSEINKANKGLENYIDNNK
jgi:hypothetical protein